MSSHSMCKGGYTLINGSLLQKAIMTDMQLTGHNFASDWLISKKAYQKKVVVVSNRVEPELGMFNYAAYHNLIF